MAASAGSTGIAALDAKLMDGLPMGSTVLVSGMPGSGLELFAKQFAGAGAKDEAVVYFTTAERDEDIVNTMHDFGWTADVTIVNIGNQYYEAVLARRLEASRYRQEGVTIKDLQELHAVAAGTKREVNFLTTLAYETSQLRSPFRLVVDALDFFLESYSPTDVLSSLRTIKAHTQRSEGLALLTMLSGVHDPSVQSGVEAIVDCIFELERIRDGNEFKRNLVIRKVRNHPEKTGIHPMSLTKQGIQIE